MKISGSCLCGEVEFEADHQGAEVVVCHCGQCRKQSGHLWSATAVPNVSLKLSKETTLAWYAASNFAKRGFCSACGTSLFWRENDGENTHVGLGVLNAPTNLKLQKHIFMAHKGDYYEVADDLPKVDDY
jgi:hypothetical protein